MTGQRDESAIEPIAIEAVRRHFDDTEAIEVRWRFDVHGGTFGELEAATFAAACAEAVATTTPLVTVVRTGGTRLQQGMRSLVGIPRAALALADLAAAGLPHVSVAAHPTTGGVWVAIGSLADVRAAVRGATVGFSGPRVVEAMTGEPVPRGANTGESAAAAGLVDALLDADGLDVWVGRVLRALRAGPLEPAPVGGVGCPRPPARHGWDQVVHSRTAPRSDGADLANAMLADAVALRGGDDTVTASVGRLHDRPVVVAAVAARRAGRVSVAGYRLLTRAARLADRLRLPLVTLVDSAGADPLPASEDDGIAAAIGTALTAVIGCGSPTVAVVHGEGGSGGALAAAVCDTVIVTTDGWFAALAPEGAAAALRTTPEDAAEIMRLAPAELLADGFADEVVAGAPAAVRDRVAAELARLSALAPEDRATRRHHRWRDPLPPAPDDSP